jgi:hypothetical protein
MKKTFEELSEKYKKISEKQIKQILIEKYIKPSDSYMRYPLTNGHPGHRVEVWFNKKGKLHSFLGHPSEVLSEDGFIIRKRWTKNGKNHRNKNLPSWIQYDRSGNIAWQNWYKNGIFLHGNSGFKGLNVLYCRVSDSKQRQKLNKQEQLLKNYAISNNYEINYVFKDISNGLNKKSKEFNNLLTLIFKKQVNKIFISEKEIIATSEFYIFKNIFKKFGTEICVIN